MTIEKKGAWWVDGGAYAKGLAGTLGQDVDRQSDTLGWALRSLKYELDYNGFSGAMVLDSPLLGDAADHQIKAFQAARGLFVDGKAGPRTLAALLVKRCQTAELAARLPAGATYQVLGHESSYDLSAIGSSDYLDRGCTQAHIYPSGTISLGQAIRPAYAVQRLAAQLALVASHYDLETARASWNVGEAAAEWWHDEGKPRSGSPSWWPFGDLSARIVGYLADLAAVPVAY